MSTAIAMKSVTLIPEAEMAQMLQLDSVSKAAASQLVVAEKERNDMVKGLVMARAMKTLRALMTDKIMADVMELMNTPLGFKTDRPNATNNTFYTKDEVRDVLIQALLRGLQPVDNQFNIIAGNLYVTKEGYERMLQEFPGLQDLQFDLGVPATNGDGALVTARATWVLDGRPGSISCERGEKPTDPDYRIPVRVNKAMGIDAILGKAKSKLLRRIYERLTGTMILSEADTDGGDILEGNATPVQQTETPKVENKS